MRHSGTQVISAILALSSVGCAAPAEPQRQGFVGKFYDESIIITDGVIPEVIEIPFPDAARLAALVNVTTDAFNPDGGNAHAARSLNETGHQGPLERRQLSDRRYRVPDLTRYPWNTVGKVEGPGYFCSGTLVGPRHLLTARHCLSETRASEMRFRPGHPQENYGAANVARIYQYPAQPAPCDQASDYVVLALAEPLGNRAGWMGSSTFQNMGGGFNQGQFGNIGYPGDKGGNEMWSSDAVSVHRIGANCGDSWTVSTNTYVVGGMSGGPVWRWGSDNAPYNLGPLSGVSNVESSFAGGQAMVNLIIYGRNDWS